MEAPFSIPVLSIVFMFISGVIAIALPIFIARHLLIKKKAPLKVFFIGAFIFILFVLVIEAFVNNTLLQNTGSFGESITQNIWLFALYGGLAAGLFEEVGRLVAFKFILKKEKKKETALMYGIGHGGTESIILVGLTMISYVISSILLNMNQLHTLIPDQATLAATYDSLSVLADLSSFEFLFAGFERIVAIILQISLSVIVFKALTTKGKGYLFFIAILIHALVDFVAVLLMHYTNTLIVELAILVLTGIVVFYALKLYKSMNNHELIQEEASMSESQTS